MYKDDIFSTQIELPFERVSEIELTKSTKHSFKIRCI